jgi:hypothetical protein
MANNRAFSKPSAPARQWPGAQTAHKIGSWIIEVRPGGGSPKRFLVRPAFRREDAIAAVLQIVGVDANLVSVNRADGEQFKAPDLGTVTELH